MNNVPAVLSFCVKKTKQELPAAAHGSDRRHLQTKHLQQQVLNPIYCVMPRNDVEEGAGCNYGHYPNKLQCRQESGVAVHRALGAHRPP
jgi:hypothetical protein